MRRGGHFTTGETASSLTAVLGDVRVSGVAGVIGPALFSVMSFVSEQLYEGGDALRASVSTLVLGRYGWLQAAAFVVIAIVMLILSRLLYISLPKGQRLRLATRLLVLVGLGFLFVGIFKTDLAAGPVTPQGLAHLSAGGTSAIAFPIACLLLVSSLRQDRRWRGLATYTLVTGCLGIILGIAQLTVPQTFDLFGLQERLMGVNGLIWMGVMSAKAAVLSASPRVAAAS